MWGGAIKGKGCSKVQLSISLPWQERNARRSCLQRRSIQEKYFYEKPHLDNLSSPVNRCSGDKTVCCTLFVRHRWLQLYQKGCRGAYLGLVITTFFHLSIHSLIYLSKILNENWKKSDQLWSWFDDIAFADDAERSTKSADSVWWDIWKIYCRQLAILRQCRKPPRSQNGALQHDAGFSIFYRNKSKLNI